MMKTMLRAPPRVLVSPAITMLGDRPTRKAIGPTGMEATMAGGHTHDHSDHGHGGHGHEMQSMGFTGVFHGALRGKKNPVFIFLLSLIFGLMIIKSN